MIDAGLPDEWPDAVIGSVLSFQQGDLVSNPPFMYVASPRHGVWELTRSSGDAELMDDLLELDAEDGFPYGMIATETCDLTEEDRRYRKHPWLALAPVYEAGNSLPPDTLGFIRDGRYSYLRSIEDGALGEGVWIVDARILIPVEKSWLVGKLPIRVFRDPASLADVADFFADRFRRVDLDARLHEALIKPLRRWLERLSPQRARQVLGHVKEVRLAVSGDPLNPDGASLILVIDDKANVDRVRSEWERKWEGWRERADQVGIALLATAYETYDSLSARGYRESLPIDISFN